ncbi:hypothetical protein TBLA_0J00410 [Henningerozyma blattae CBS 6284]|uniref:Replication factor C subunit 1 n=1 Tax=Henningerozyma blattae (strain ATCC 34711 / CBS 6284 / DSM 70876 / NBRC 10599 / NRRL Y-10934 / UCD 77-7) TaxID=1071380 RepID=I2H9I9_HENB6|nr:hypothetical protein TBLA_0J00410 [Tetrapisispora blattae CBS 6284]CCH63041.1 hypothetical protein TBLA_0J00410 [Tetrapisispora blattae CBS 6284]
MVGIDEFFKSNKRNSSLATKNNSSSSNSQSGSRSTTTRNSKNQTGKKSVEIIDLDDLDDDLEKLASKPPSSTSSSRRSTKRSSESIEIEDSTPKKAKKAAVIPKPAGSAIRKSTRSTTASNEIPIKTTGKVKKETSVTTSSSPNSSGITAQDVLSKIPSVDLDTVHVKENISFDFKGNSNTEDVDMSEASDLGLPEGKPNCLLGLTMVFTGQLPTIERGVAENLAKRYGARVTKSISGKTSVVVLGDEAGPKKLEKIKQLGIKAIDEDGLKQLISGMPGGGGSGVEAEKARLKQEAEELKVMKEVEEIAKKEKEAEIKKSKLKASNNDAPHKVDVREQDKLWTVKYAPTNISQICGNKTVVKRLTTWLANWDDNKKKGFKVVGKDGNGIYRAAMLHGPPGIGKTTAAHLVAKDLGYDILEQNASDVRSKSLLNAGVKNALDNMSVVGFFKTHENKDHDITGNAKKFLIIMDEVDGMSGGDRGGVGQLAQFCRKTETPMILICNERNLPKMRPFDRVCLDLPFRRPDANSIKSRLMTIAVREGFKLDPNIIDRLVQATRADIRQIINLLSTVSKTTKSINHENILTISKEWEKQIALKPFDITSKLLSGSIYTELGSKTFTLNDKMGLYFDDFDFTPLMIQENYLSTRPSVLPRGQSHLEAVANAANSISEGDLVERKIRSNEQLWSLLPLHAVMSSVRPSSMVAGQMAGRINFTTWLGQNSKMNKYLRILQELQYHTRLSTSSDKTSFRLEYMPLLRRRLLKPLLDNGSDGIDEIIELMDKYYLTKEDWDYIMEFNNTEITQLKKIPSSVKSSFTRKYNSMTHPVAIYRAGMSIGNSNGGSKAKPDFEDVVDADDEEVKEEVKEDEDTIDLKKDKLIKAKARPTKRKSTKTTTAKGRVTKKVKK